MSRKPLGPINCNSDMRVGVVPAEHDVLDLVDEIEDLSRKGMLYNSSENCVALARTAALRADPDLSRGEDVRGKAVEAAALLVFAVKLMDAGR